MLEHIHLAPGYSTFEEIEAEHEIYDASTLDKIASCPREHQIRNEERLVNVFESAPMISGIAIHYGLEHYYASPKRGPELERMSIELMRDTYRSFNLDFSKVPAKHEHLTEDHLVGVMRNYFDDWRTEGGRMIEIFTPIAGIRVEDLDLSDVLAARFRLTPTGDVILGESNLVMRFEVDGHPLILAGKPDLPVRDQMGDIYTMDHKTTSSFLSDWWAEKHNISNKDRGYMAMLRSLMGVVPKGSVINGIYVGKYANNPDSKATKSTRFPFDFTEAHIDEALRNQLEWIETIKHYRRRGYFPQGCQNGCKHPDLCRRDPPTRELVKQDPTRYVPNTRRFWDL